MDDQNLKSIILVSLKQLKYDKIWSLMIILLGSSQEGKKYILYDTYSYSKSYMWYWKGEEVVILSTKCGKISSCFIQRNELKLPKDQFKCAKSIW